MSDLANRYADIDGKLNVLQEQYSHAIYSASIAPTTDNQTTLQTVEGRVNKVSAGIYRLQNDTAKRLSDLTSRIDAGDLRTSQLVGDLKLLGNTDMEVDVSQSSILEKDTQAELENTAYTFYANLTGLLLVASMIYSTRSRT
jgi:hypothetical protein